MNGTGEGKERMKETRWKTGISGRKSIIIYV